MAIRAQATIDDYADPFASFVLPRYFEGRPLYERLKIIALRLAAENEVITSDDLRDYIPPGKNRKVLEELVEGWDEGQGDGFDADPGPAGEVPA